jgi:hypothetical protein
MTIKNIFCLAFIHKKEYLKEIYQSHITLLSFVQHTRFFLATRFLIFGGIIYISILYICLEANKIFQIYLPDLLVLIVPLTRQEWHQE